MKRIIFILFFITFAFSCSLFVGIGEEDKEAPKIVISSPVDGAIYSPGTIVVSGAASDNDRIKEIILSVEGRETISLGKEKNFQYNLTLNSPGTYKITIRAIDNVGNTSESSVTIYIDTGGPVISFTSPLSNTHYKGNVNVTGSISDDNGINVVQWSMDGIKWNTLKEKINSKSYDFSFVLDSTTYEDGFYYLYIQAKDVTSKISTAYVPIFINNKISNIIFYPKQGQAISGTETIQGTIIANLPSFISNISILVKTNGNIYYISNIQKQLSYSHQFDTTPLNSGDNVEFSIIVNSYSGLSITDSVSTYVDKSYPSLSITFPTNGAFLMNAPYDFFGTATDDTGIKEVAISFDNNSFYRVSISNNGSTYHWYTNIHTSTLTEGNNELYVAVKDIDNKTKTTRLLFTVDKTLPVISIISPTNGATVGTNFAISASASDNNFISSFFIRMDGAVIASNSTHASFVSIYKNFVTNLSGEGERILEFVAFDGAGNNANTTYTIYINENPARTSNVVITSEAGNQIFLKGMASITGTSYDEGSVKDVYYRLDSGEEIKFVSDANVTSTNWNFSLDTRNYSDGAHKLFIKAVDNLGGYTVYTTNVFIDNSRPFVSVLNISDYESYGGYINLQVSITDNVSLLSLKVLTNGGEFTNDTSIPSGTKNKFYVFPDWDISTQPDGITNEIVSIVVDRVYLTNVVTNRFIVSNDLPLLTINTPSPGQYISSNVTVSGRAIKSPEGIKPVILKIGGGSYITADINNISADGCTNDFSHNLNTKVVSEGNQIISVRAISSNNSYIQKDIAVVVDYTPPSLSIVSPTNSESYYGTLTINGTASDNLGITNVNVYIKTNGVALASWNPAIVSLSGNSWTTNWDTTTLPVGNVEITVEAIDFAGNKTTQTKNVTIRPYISSISMDSIWIGGTLTINGSNFGTGSVKILFKGVTNTETANNTTVSTTINAQTRSGYMLIEINGITSINSNWIDIWEMTSYTPSTSAQINTRFKAYNNKIYFVQCAKSASSWATNFLYSDFTGTFTNYPFFGSTIPNGEVAGLGNAIDARGNLVAMAYSPVKQTGIWVTTYTNNGTTLVKITNVKIDTITLQGSDPLLDIRIASDLSIHVAYSDYNSSKIKYAKSTDYGNTWTIENAVTGISFHPLLKDAQPSINIDSEGTPHILYFDYGSGNLRHAYKLAPYLWTAETVDSYMLNGTYSDIEIDSENGIHCSYYNEENGDLIYSYKPASGSWTRVLVDYSAITGKYSSIALYGSEKAISYYSESYTTAYLAYNNGENINKWRIIKIPQHTSLSLPYGRFSGVNFRPDGSEIWVGFVETLTLKLWVAKYKK